MLAEMLAGCASQAERTAILRYRAARVERIATERPRDVGTGHRIDQDYLADSNAHADLAAVEAFRVADRRIGGGHLYPILLSYLRGSIGPRLVLGGDVSFAAAASLTEMAGWMAHDGGHDDEARSHFRRAARLADASGSPDLAGGIAATQAHLELQLRSPRRAVDIAQSARACLAAGPTYPRLVARLLAMEARGHAMQGDKGVACKRYLQAEVALAERDEHTSFWVAPFDEASLAGEAALGLQEMGDFASATSSAERVVALRLEEHARSRAFAYLTVAATVLTQPSPDPLAACDAAARAIAGATTVASTRLVRRLRSVRALLQPYRTVPEVAHFLEMASQSDGLS